ncbi:hypothetical protein [Aurantiacibacter rhizosphaerae]|uniref:Tryptophan-rich sensory protein n=1 Tax=Aurantiacibacter rhizosphaerae TaxID=2691582 RepID=A0A844XFA9_9SPHN|nr:hypothetical protein [Aurantiacibacter rhizosphaerae]MWV28195.1 hypothetical protein [Aurantiacibacter rhizosphaerae]
MAIGTSPRRTPYPRSPLQRFAVILAVILQVGATFLPSFGIGEDIGSRSDATRTLITPAGWAFAIWGPLFFGSVVFALYQALPSQRHSALLNRVAWPAAGAFALNGLWALYTQVYALTFASVVIILFSLVCILMVYRTLVHLDRDFTTVERWIVVLTLSALAAWLTAASIVNISATLVYYGVGANSDKVMLASGVIGLGGLIAAVAVWRGRGNPVYAGVFLWALIAIYAAGGQTAPSLEFATIAAGLLVLGSVLMKLRHAANRKHWLG